MAYVSAGWCKNGEKVRCRRRRSRGRGRGRGRRSNFLNHELKQLYLLTAVYPLAPWSATSSSWSLLRSSPLTLSLLVVLPLLFGLWFGAIPGVVAYLFAVVACSSCRWVASCALIASTSVAAFPELTGLPPRHSAVLGDVAHPPAVKASVFSLYLPLQCHNLLAGQRS